MMTPLRQRMLDELQRRNYSSKTIRLYLRHVADFAKHFHRSPDQLGAEDIRQYQLFLIRDKKLPWSSYNQIVCALRFFYAKTLKRAFLLQEIPLPRMEQRLPTILSPEEVAKVLSVPAHLKTRALLMTIYAAGLLDALERAFKKHKVTLAGQLTPLQSQAEFAALLPTAAHRNWVVYAKRPFAGPAQVLTYLSRYTHRIAIANSRLLAMADGRVTFRWRDYAHGHQTRINVVYMNHMNGHKTIGMARGLCCVAKNIDEDIALRVGIGAHADAIVEA
jgi:hypothetical protein